MYGIKGADSAPGNDTIRAYFPASKITANVIAEADAGRYPPGNFFPSLAQFKGQFMSFADGDYRLIASSQWLRAGTDGAPLGASISAGSSEPPLPTPPDLRTESKKK
jgi:hypothetical protein